MRLLAGFVEGLETSPEPLAFAAAAALLTAVALAAAYAPARRAARIDPLRALQQQ